MIGQYNLFFRFPDRQHTKRNFSQKWSSNTICGRFSIKISFLSKKHILSHMHFFLRTMHVRFLKNTFLVRDNPLIFGPILFVLVRISKIWSLFVPVHIFQKYLALFRRGPSSSNSGPGSYPNRTGQSDTMTDQLRFVNP